MGRSWGVVSHSSPNSRFSEQRLLPLQRDVEEEQNDTRLPSTTIRSLRPPSISLPQTPGIPGAGWVPGLPG